MCAPTLTHYADGVAGLKIGAIRLNRIDPDTIRGGCITNDTLCHHGAIARSVPMYHIKDPDIGMGLAIAKIVPKNPLQGSCQKKNKKKTKKDWTNDFSVLY